jgi:tagatose-1,6-bisphosphate aldolase
MTLPGSVDQERAGPGTIRGLRQIAGLDGRVAVVAVDQRQTLRRMLTEAGRDATDAALRGFKRAVAAAVGDACSALLVDPELGLAALSADPDIPARLPLIVSLEESGAVSFQGGRRGLLVAGFGPRRARLAGACAGKLLCYLRCDHAPTRLVTVALIDAVGRGCRAADLPFVLELVPYRLDDEPPDAYRAGYTDHVLEAARLGAAHHPHLLKLPWPVVDEADPRPSLRVLRDLDVPWALLSAGAGFDAFADRLRRALDDGGACGFIAGRALWQEAVAGRDTTALLDAVARPRLHTLLELTAARGRALRLPNMTSDPTWFRG